MKIKNSIMTFLVGMLNGLFGSGGGVLTVYMLENLYGVEKKKSHATAILIMVCVSLISIFIYARHDFVDLGDALWVSLGGVGGSVLGAVLLKKLPLSWIRRIFGIVMLAAAVRILFA